MEDDSKNFNKDELISWFQANSKKNWDQDEVISLIKVYESYENVWNPYDPDFRNKIKKQESIAEIAKVFGTSSNEITKKIHSLLTQFRNEEIILRKNPNKKVPWFGYKYLSFLNNKHNRRRDNNISKERYETDNDDDKSNEKSYEEYVTQDDDRPDDYSRNESMSPHKKQKLETVYLGESPYSCLETSYGAVQSMTVQKDEIKVFAELLECKLRKLSRHPRKLCILKHHIEELIFKTEMELFDSEL